MMSHQAAPQDQGYRGFTTADVAECDRDAYWSGVLSRYFGRLNICTLGDAAPVSTLLERPVSFLHTFRFDGGRFRVWHDNPHNETTMPDGIKLVLQVRGSSMIEQDGRSGLAVPGGWSLYDPTRPYRVSSTDDVEHVIVLIPRSRIFDRSFPRLTGPLVVDPDQSSMARIISSFVLSYVRDAAPLHNAIADCLAETTVSLVRCELLARSGIRHNGQSSPEILRMRIKQYVVAHLADPDLSIDRIASAMGCSKRYLHMVFEPEGTTLERLIWQLRIDQCREALLDGRNIGKSISEIAFRSGFTSSAHFCRAFKSQSGMSPTAFRRTASTQNSVVPD